MGTFFGVLVLLAINLWVWIGFVHFFNKIRSINKSNAREVEVYTKGAVIGVASGTVVLVVDRITTMVINNPPKLDFGNVGNLMLSIVGALLYILIASGILLLCVAFLMYKAMKHLKK